MKKKLLGLLILFVNICSAQSFYFKSGFENSSILKQYELNGNPNNNYADIYGTDNNTEFDWEADLDNHPNTNIGNFRIYYEVGDTLKVKASIVDDPLNNANKVLKFKLNSANIPNNGNSKDRIQAAINGNTNLKEFSFKVKLYIHPDVDTLKYYNDDFNWLTLMEFWNNDSSQPYPFRITLNIQKPNSVVGSNLYFGTHGQTKNTTGIWDNVWENINTTYPIPTGEWITFETYFFEGDSTNGRYKVTITDSNQNTYVLFNITNYTHHPDDPLPDGVTNFNPMKLYTSGILIDGMSAVNAELSVYWDDFEFWTNTTVLSLEEFNNNKTPYFYPNPVQSLINTEYLGEYKEILIYNTNGILIKQIPYTTSKIINLSFLSSGLYIIDICYIDKKINFKIIKE